MSRLIHILLMLACLFGTSLSPAATPDDASLAYLQYGQWDSAREGAVGIQTPWPISFGDGPWSTFWQGELGDWFTKKQGREYESSGEIAVGPVGRYYLNGARALYLEGLINISFVAPRFWRDSEQQGTVFNFGGAFAFGYRFGQSETNEISIRSEHFSNGGLREPNPGRNFFQIRYAHAF